MTTDLGVLVTELDAAECRQTNHWWRMLELEEAARDERRAYTDGRHTKQDLEERVDIINDIWHVEQGLWVDARDEVERLARLCDQAVL